MKTIKSLITVATVLGVAQLSLGFAPPRTKPKERIPVPAVEKNPMPTHKPGDPMNPMDPMRAEGEAKKEDAMKLATGIDDAKSLVCESGDNKVVINLNEPSVNKRPAPTEADAEAFQQNLEVSKPSQVVIKSKDSSVKFEVSSLNPDSRTEGATYNMMNPTTEPLKQKLFIDTIDHKSAKLILWPDNSKDGERVEMLCHFYAGNVDADKLNIEKPSREATKAALKLNGLPELKEEPMTPPAPPLPENADAPKAGEEKKAEPMNNTPDATKPANAEGTPAADMPKDDQLSKVPAIDPISSFLALGYTAYQNRDAILKTVNSVRNSAIVGEVTSWWNTLATTPASPEAGQAAPAPEAAPVAPMEKKQEAAPTPSITDDEAFLPEFTPEELLP